MKEFAHASTSVSDRSMNHVIVFDTQSLLFHKELPTWMTSSPHQRFSIPILVDHNLSMPVAPGKLDFRGLPCVLRRCASFSANIRYAIFMSMGTNIA